MRNNGATAQTITRVTSDVTSSVMAMTETDKGGVGSMTDLGRVTIPAHASFSFTPDHQHLMLEHPTRALEQGDHVTMTITFSRAGTVTLRLPVVPITGPSAPMTGMSMGGH